MAAYELIRGVEVIWLIWVTCIALSSWMVVTAIRQWRNASNLKADESGAAYTLSFVMTVPIFLLLVCLIVETTLVLTAKVGTVYAAYSGARTAIVWSSATSWSRAEQKCQEAAVKSFLPFASGTEASGSQVSAGQSSAQFQRLRQAYREYDSDGAASRYLAAKYGFAQRHLHVLPVQRPAEFNSDVTVSVRYDFPFNVPGIGRILGSPGPSGRYYYPISSTVTLQNEGPQTQGGTLGIGYGTF